MRSFPIRPSKRHLACLARLGLALGGVCALFAAAGCSNGDSGGGSPDGGASASDGGPHASGDSQAPSGASCDAYCAAVMASCTGGAAQYASAADCTRECALLPAGTAGASTGDSVSCRATAAAAAANDPASHCASAGPYGGGVCGERCEAFCTIALGVCGTGAGGPWANEADCASDCAGFSFDSAVGDAHQGSDPGPTAGHDLSCREYHLQAAVDLPSPHCTHIGPVPTTDALSFPCK